MVLDHRAIVGDDHPAVRVVARRLPGREVGRRREGDAEPDAGHQPPAVKSFADRRSRSRPAQAPFRPCAARRAIAIVGCAPIAAEPLPMTETGTTYIADIDGFEPREVTTRADADPRTLHVRLGERDATVRLGPEPTAGMPGIAWIDGRRIEYVRRPTPDGTTALTLRGRDWHVDVVDQRTHAMRVQAAKQAAGGDLKITAPMPGLVLAMNVEPGQPVDAGTVVAVLEAMKMQNEIRSPDARVVKSVEAEAGASVSKGDLLMVLSPANAPDADA
jgi:biotin carboxyl carrier protein